MYDMALSENGSDNETEETFAIPPVKFISTKNQYFSKKQKFFRQNFEPYRRGRLGPFTVRYFHEQLFDYFYQKSVIIYFGVGTVLGDVCVSAAVHVCDSVLDCFQSEVLQFLLPVTPSPHGRIHSPIQWAVS